jgi:hypothetical protein
MVALARAKNLSIALANGTFIAPRMCAFDTSILRKGTELQRSD